MSYAELLAEFFASHNACGSPWSRQYRSAIFPHDEAQLAQAEKSAAAFGRVQGRQVRTAIESFTGFTLAEDYHQKYRLRRDSQLLAELEVFFPDRESFLGSTAVTRANAFLDGHGTPEVVARDLPRLGLSDAGRRTLERRFR